jgi:hypothetical protein
LSCGEVATHWYLHGADICSYCDRHDYPCGTPLTPLKEEKSMTKISNTVHYLSAPNAGQKFSKFSWVVGGYDYSDRPKVYRTANTLLKNLRRRLANLGPNLRVVSVDLTTGARTERSPQDFIKYVEDYRKNSKAQVERLDAPVRPLVDNTGAAVKLGDEVVAASYKGRPYRGKITGFTPHNVQIYVTNGKHSYHKYVAYSRFSRAVLKLS